MLSPLLPISLRLKKCILSKSIMRQKFYSVHRIILLLWHFLFPPKVNAVPLYIPFLMEDKKLFSSVADFQNFCLNVFCQVYIPFFRPFYIEPTNIVNVNDVIQRVSDHASALDKRIHYYSRLSTPADKALVRGKALLII